MISVTYTTAHRQPWNPAALVDARALLALGLLLAIGAALFAARIAPAHSGDADLALLLRFMGVIKLAMAAAAAALLAWRLATPLPRGPALVAIAGCCCLATGAVLITCLAYLLPATLLFHLGLFALLLLALQETRRLLDSGSCAAGGADQLPT